MRDISDYRIDDQHPGVSLASIHPISDRMQSLYARNKNNEHLQNRHTSTTAVIEIMRGLEYHYRNYSSLLKGIKPPSSGNPSSATDKSVIEQMGFEAWAYICRVGQLYYWTQTLNNTKSMIPKILYLMPFRHKNAAHLSLHVARPEDTEWAQDVQSMSFKNVVWIKNIPVFQTQHPQGKPHNFEITSDHNKVALEIYVVFEKYIAGTLSARPTKKFSWLQRKIAKYINQR